jgi:hypothetical protein
LGQIINGSAQSLRGTAFANELSNAARSLGL